jgi:hypothetical protein
MNGIRQIVQDEETGRKLSHPAQVGGIETAVLDDGPGRGTRVAWVNTGTPLRFRVVIDRGFDIADACWAEKGLGWISSQGIRPPAPTRPAGMSWLEGFGGGLLTTCGLMHIGGPESDEHGDRGLHGSISHCPAELVSVEQPDPSRGRFDIRMTGRMLEAAVFGPVLELRRTISARLGEPWVRVEDEVTNLGNTAAPHMILYHCNLGWPLIDEGAELKWKGETRLRGPAQAGKAFSDPATAKRCPGPSAEHAGSGEVCWFIDPEPDADGMCTIGALNATIELGLSISFRKDQLPCVTNWQHWGVREYVTGLEPGTHYPVGQRAAREAGDLIMLEPLETRRYEVTFRAASGTACASLF